MTGIPDRAGKLLAEHVATNERGSPVERARLVDAATGAPRSRPRALWVVVVAAGLCVAFGLWLIVRPVSHPAGTFTVGGDVLGQVGAYYAPVTCEIVLGFHEGSTVRVAPGASARVSHVDAHGATLVLERGSMHVDVRHRPETSWQVAAGPYSVRVTGTTFAIEWRPDAGRLEVAMEHGSVLVRGPGIESGVSVSAGQRYVTQTTSRLEALPAPSAATSLGNAASSASTAPVPEPKPEGTEPPSWAELARQGQYPKVVEAAELVGVDAALAARSADDVGALADAARYTGRAALAGRALETLRQRFPGSPRARSAAFLLGRMADDGGNPGGALGWYDTYLREVPGGPLTAEALGRRFLVLQRLGRGDEARRAAEEYLLRFPKGPYATQAGQLVEP
jgi:TolA-binding protein